VKHAGHPARTVVITLALDRKDRQRSQAGALRRMFKPRHGNLQQAFSIRVLHDT